MGLKRQVTIRRKDIILLFLLLLIVLQYFFEQSIAWWRFFDEFLVILVCLAALAFRASNGFYKVPVYNLIFFAMVLLYFLMGTISAAAGRYQSFVITAAGAFLSVKWFLMFLGIQSVYRYYPQIHIDNWDKRTLYAVIAVLSIIENLYYMGFSGSGGTLAPIQLCATSVFLLGLLFLKWEGKKADYIGMLFLLENLILSTKAKGYAAAFLAIIILYWIINKHKKITLFLISILAVGCIIVAWDKIYLYYIYGAAADHDYARARLLMTGIEIANDYFPIGTGWSTYGSYYAAEYYSPIYYLYGLSEHHELGVLAKIFLMDVYWPIVYAESGWIGFGAVGIICILLFYKVQKLFKVDERLYAAGFLTFAYMMITTVEETGFAQPALICLAILTGIIFAESDKREKMHEKNRKRLV